MNPYKPPATKARRNTRRHSILVSLVFTAVAVALAVIAFAVIDLLGDVMIHDSYFTFG